MVKKILPLSAQTLHLNGKDGQQLRKRFTLKVKIVLLTTTMLSLLVVVVILVSLLIGDSQWQSYFPSYISDSKLGIYDRAAISTDAAPCAPIGKDILQKNGSAVDCAIAVLICMGLVNPQSQGLGGGFLMTIYKRETREAIALDAREMAPLDSDENMFSGSGNLSRYGGLSIAVPSEIAGFAKAHEKYGILPWSDLFLPSIELAKNGFPVSKHLAEKLSIYSNVVSSNEVLKKTFTNNETGDFYKEGETMFRRDLAKTFEILAKDGEKAFYDPTHAMAATMLHELKDAGSIITAKDYEAYEARWMDPISIRLINNFTVHTTPVPGSGALLAFMLNILDGYNITADDAKTKDCTVLTVHRILETFKFAYAKRMYLEDDENSVIELLQNLTSTEYAEETRSKIDDRQTFKDPMHYGLKNFSAQPDDHGTAHMVVVAPNGDVVSVTSTINIYFGSAVISESTGIIFNDEMDDFSNPNVTSYFGVPPSPFNRIKPKRRPMSSMAPTIVIDSNDNVRLALGGNGGTKITTGILQVMLRNLWLDEDIKMAIDSPRFHHQLLPDYINYEKNYPKEILDALKERGHIVEEISSGMLSVIMGIARQKNGRLEANSDYRKRGDVSGF